MICDDVLWWCFVKMLCDYVLWLCFVIMFCDNILWSYFVIMYCDDALWKWSVIMICDDALWWFFVKMICDNDLRWWFVMMICDDGHAHTQRQAQGQTHRHTNNTHLLRKAFRISWLGVYRTCKPTRDPWQKLVWKQRSEMDWNSEVGKLSTWRFLASPLAFPEQLWKWIS